MKKPLLVLLAAISTASFINANAQKTGMHVIKSLPIASSGGWDYLEVGPINNWLYVSHATQVNILNKTTGDSVGVIPNTTGIHGIAFDVANKKGFTSNGKLNTVTVFDMNTNQVTGEIKVGENPDAIFYEPFSKKIVTCNGRSKDLTIIDPSTNTVTKTVALGGKPETAVSNGKGKMYVNVEDKNEIVEVDTKTFTVLNHWSLAPCEGPTGLAIDLTTNRLFAGCDKMAAIVDATTGKLVSKLPIGDGCDGVAFDPATKNLYTANGEGNITVIHENAADKFSVVETIPTKSSARTIAIDKDSHLLYLPAAETFPIEAGEKRAKQKPGTFQILVVGK